MFYIHFDTYSAIHTELNIHFTLTIFYSLVRQTDKRIACEEEYSDSEDEDGDRKDRRDHKKKKQKENEDKSKEANKGSWFLRL